MLTVVPAAARGSLLKQLITLLSCASLAALATAASAAEITPVGVTATSLFPFADIYRPQRLIDGSGLSAGLHSNDFNAMFLTPQEDQQATLTFDLGARYDLDGASLWNYNFGDPGFFSLLRRGVRDFSIGMSNDGVSFSTVYIGVLAQGTGQPLTAQRFGFAGTGRYVTLNILSNHASGDYDANDTGSGLSEVRFSGTVSDVPEPATWTMMIGGFGLIGASLRRRQRTPLPVAI